MNKGNKMAAETKNYEPDEFLQNSSYIEKLFADVDMPIPELGKIAVRRHLHLVPGQAPEPRSHEQQAAEYLGQSIFPSPFRPAS
jgi:hypothetical protein